MLMISHRYLTGSSASKPSTPDESSSPMTERCGSRSRASSDTIVPHGERTTQRSDRFICTAGDPLAKWDVVAPIDCEDSRPPKGLLPIRAPSAMHARKD